MTESVRSSAHVALAGAGVYSDDVVQQTFEGTERLPSNGGQLAIWLGLAISVLSLTVALGQVERGANRIYGIQRDRPTSDKYVRAAVMGLLTGIPGIIGLMLLLAGGAAAAAIHDVYDLDPLWLQTARWPVGAALTLLSLISIFNRSPRRRQPSWEWLAVGAAVALFLWLLFTTLLVLYLRYTPSFGAVYGPLTAVIALLLWTTLTSIAVFLGLAVAAQLEAIRAGVPAAPPMTPNSSGPPSRDRCLHQHSTLSAQSQRITEATPAARTLLSPTRSVSALRDGQARDCLFMRRITRPVALRDGANTRVEGRFRVMPRYRGVFIGDRQHPKREGDHS